MNNSSSWEVSFYDLFMYILQRWRMLLVFLVIGAVLAGGIGLLTSVGSAKDTSVISEEMHDRWSAGLTAEQKQNIEIIASQILYRERIIQGGKSFVEDSYFMELDPYHMFTCNLYYSVIPEQEDSMPYKLASLVTAYVSVLNDEQTRQMVDEVLDPDNNRNDAEGILGEERTRIVNIAADDKDLGIFSITVCAKSQEDQDVIIQVIQDVISAQKEKITGSLGMHTVFLLGIDQSTELNDNVRTDQIEIIQSVKKLEEELTAMKASLVGAEEKQYLEYLLQKAETDNRDEENIAIEESSDKEKETGVSFFSMIRSNLKKVVIGALLGLVIAVILLIIRYVTGGKVRRPADLEKSVNARVIARFDADTAFIRAHHTGLDRWLHKKRNNDPQDLSYQERIAAAAAGIELITERNEMKKITLLAPDVQISKLAEDISAAITGDTEINVINDLNSSTDGISQLQNTDGVILAAETDVTLLKEINNITGICYQCQIPVIGAVILE